MFRSTTQFEEERFDEYYTYVNAEPKNQIVFGCFSDKLRDRA
jgi:hypothetical protein